MLEASGYKLSLQFNVIISKRFSNGAPACDYDNNISTYLNINLGIYLLNTYVNVTSICSFLLQSCP